MKAILILASVLMASPAFAQFQSGPPTRDTSYQTWLRRQQAAPPPMPLFAQGRGEVMMSTRNEGPGMIRVPGVPYTPEEKHAWEARRRAMEPWWRDPRLR